MDAETHQDAELAKLLSSISAEKRLQLLEALLPLCPEADFARIHNRAGPSLQRLTKLEDLPDELLIHVFSYLNAPSLAATARSCQRFAALVRDDHLWRLLRQRQEHDGSYDVFPTSPSKETHRFVHDNRKSERQDSAFATSLPSRFCEMFRQGYLTARNWRRGEYRVSRVVRRTGSLHTDFDVGQALAVSLSVNGASLWNYSKSSQAPQVLHPGSLTTVRMCDDFIVSAGAHDGTIRVSCKHSQELVCVIQSAHVSEIGALICERGWIVSGGEDGVVQVWELNTHNGRMVAKSLVVLRDQHKDGVTAIALDQRRKRVASASADGAVWVNTLQPDMRTQSIELQTAQRDPVFSLALSKEFLLVGDAQGNVSVWAMTGAEPRHVTRLNAHAGPVICLQLDTHKFVSAGGDKLVKVWSLYQSNVPLYSIRHNALIGPISALRFDSRMLVCSDVTSTLVEYDFGL
ncbi:WD40-repeat-containing domain protein [Catenaria anguillulae PL171]|uniref:WD40-repeat-containing domain protein n=1 Tax=Catenaria anguillulae PL171 TaxID=765915 RepID=A0A1Y2HE89_9FUNG|nr:WD40-repeat-containing domain protein [Catenaria anguillulae PL171]